MPFYCLSGDDIAPPNNEGMFSRLASLTNVRTVLLTAMVSSLDVIASFDYFDNCLATVAYEKLLLAALVLNDIPTRIKCL